MSRNSCFILLYKAIIFIIYLSSIQLGFAGDNLRKIFNQYSCLENEVLLEVFPYDSGFIAEDFSNLESLLNIYRIAKSYGIDGDMFLANGYDAFINKNISEIANVATYDSLLKEAEKYMDWGGEENMDFFMIMADIALAQTSRACELFMLKKSNWKDENTFVQVIESLKKHNYHPTRPPLSPIEKFFDNLEAGNYSYIWDRFKTRYMVKSVSALVCVLILLALARFIILRIHCSLAKDKNRICLSVSFLYNKKSKNLEKSIKA